LHKRVGPPVLPVTSADTEDPEWDQLLRNAAAETAHANIIHERLLAGAKNELLDKKIEPSLGLKRTADFLAFLSRAESFKLPRAVKGWLESLGVSHTPRKLGRPKGRRADLSYATYVVATVRKMEQAGIFSTREQFKKQRGHNWRLAYTKSLARTGVSPEEIEFFANSRSVRSCAIKIASSHFGVSYDAIDRACRRYASSAKK
jgi:hypothetical protein